MATFVKKVSGVSFYEINGIRAAGIIPYYIDKGKVMILINREVRNKQIVYNCIGGKVESFDNSVEDTALREFNEETGYIASDLIKRKIGCKDNLKFHLKKSKYITILTNIKNNFDWKMLPYNYQKIFEDVEVFNDRDSLDLQWIDLFKFKEKNKSYLLSLTLYNIRNHNKFRGYDPDNEPLFLPD